MEFWGIEVKSGQPFKVENEFEKLLHLSQATLGETKANKGNESVPISVKINDQKFVLGTLSEKTPQLTFDLVFEKDFELSHNWKNGSVYFMGYKSVVGDDYESGSESDEDIDVPLPLENGKTGTKTQVVKPSTAKASLRPESSDKPKVKPTEDAQKKPQEDDSDDVDDSDDDEDDSGDDVEMGFGEDDSSDEDGEDDSSDDEDEDEDTPKKVEQSKKRVGESAAKTPLPAKKAKFSSPQKTDGKKSVHTATPHPSKQAAKTPANDKKIAQTPTSATCSTCNKTFKTEAGLQSHTQAKHSAAK